MTRAAPNNQYNSSQQGKSPDGKPIVEFQRKSAWMSWLKKNHDRSTGVWLRLAKKTSGLTSISRNEALDVALCYGWIDGQARSEGDTTWLQKFTPRTKRSIWSKKNRENVERLINSGEMHSSGLAEIERAKSAGRWDAAHDSPRTMAVPDDLRQALEKNKKATKSFETLDSRNRYAILFRILNAKRPETRARRIKEFVEMLARGDKLHK